MAPYQQRHTPGILPAECVLYLPLETKLKKMNFLATWFEEGRIQHDVLKIATKLFLMSGYRCVENKHVIPLVSRCADRVFCSSVCIFLCFYKESTACAFRGRRLVCQFAIVPWSRICSILEKTAQRY